MGLIFGTLLTAVAVTLSHAGGDDLHCSTADIIRLAGQQKHLADVVENYIRSTETILKHLQSIKDSQALALTVEDVLHPIGSYNFIKRAAEWKKHAEAISIKEEEMKELSGKLRNASISLPSYATVESFLRELMVLRREKDLDPLLMAQGNITTHLHQLPVVGSLTARDCQLMSFYASADDLWCDALMWAHVGLFLRTDDVTNEAPGNSSQLKDGWETLLRSCQYENVSDAKALCKVESKVASENSVLRCHYHDNENPHLLLGPLRVEEVSLDPHILLFHDFLTLREVRWMLDVARNRTMHRSLVVGGDGISELYRGRTSKQLWVSADLDRITANINNRISWATGLTTEGAFSEKFQLANYGVGGQYVVHLDSNEYLQRIATFMTYLSEVEAGGSTVFSNLDLAIRPQVGSAVFWWNHLHDMTLDDLTAHGGCPVLYGSKWILNKWIKIWGLTGQCLKEEKEDITFRLYF